MKKITLLLTALGLVAMNNVLALDREDVNTPGTVHGLRIEQREKLVFVLGSNIPRRVKIKSIGTDTVDPIRVIDRTEINATNAKTAAGVVALDPSFNVRGHYSRTDFLQTGVARDSEKVAQASRLRMV